LRHLFHKAKLIKQYIITIRGQQQHIDSPLTAHQLVHSMYSDVVSKATVTSDGLSFNSPSLGTVYITWSGNAHS